MARAIGALTKVQRSFYLNVKRVLVVSRRFAARPTDLREFQVITSFDRWRHLTRAITVTE